MYEAVERQLNAREIRLLKSKRRQYEEQIRPAYRVVLVSALLGYGATGLIVLAGNLLSKDSAPLWFTLLILLGVGTYLFVSLCGTGFKQNRQHRRMTSIVDDALQHGLAREEIVQSDRMVEIEAIDDEGACYLLEVEDRKLLLLCGQEYYSGPKFPSTNFSLVEIQDARGNTVEFLIEKRGARLKPYKVISAKNPLKDKIPYDHKFLNCSLDEHEEHLEAGLS